MTDEPTIALVTGANKGIGRAIAAQFADLGMTVLLGSRDVGRGKKAAGELRAAGGDVHEIVLDVRDPATIEAVAAHIDAGYGRLDMLVNNAGISGTGVGGQRPGEVDLAAVRTVFETNLFGVIAVTEAMLPLLRRSSRARIVNVSSSTGSIGLMTDPEHYFAQLPGVVGYPVSKAALNMITVQYAKALAADGITVNAIAPGACATDFIKGLPPAIASTITRTAAQGAAVAVRVATGGPGGPTAGFFDEDGSVPW
jgi:NAD(P)-dependent dehydrogenase (short-subunit alcohol dehydrogenase family)